MLTMLKQLAITASLLGALAGAHQALADESPLQARALAAEKPDVLNLVQGRWSALSRTAVAITGDVRLRDNVLVFNGKTRYSVEPTRHVGGADKAGGVLELDGQPFFRLRLLGARGGVARPARPVYLRGGNTLCGDRDAYLYAQFETQALGGVDDAVLSIRIFEPPKSAGRNKPHYCAAYNYLRDVEPAKASQPVGGAGKGKRL